MQVFFVKQMEMIVLMMSIHIQVLARIICQIIILPHQELIILPVLKETLVVPGQIQITEQGYFTMFLDKAIILAVDLLVLVSDRIIIFKTIHNLILLKLFHLVHLSI